MITEELLPCMQGFLPSTIITVDADGVPNTTVISQTYYVDEEHVALSNQFFNKTVRNYRANPKACVILLDPRNYEAWLLEITHLRSEVEGPLFDQMEMQLEAIASMCGMEDVFSLQSAEVFKVDAVNKLY